MWQKARSRDVDTHSCPYYQRPVLRRRHRYFTPTARGEKRSIPSFSVMYAIASCALTLFPALSSGGANTAIAPLPGTTEIMPPPTPLLDGSPTCHAQLPEPS